MEEQGIFSFLRLCIVNPLDQSYLHCKKRLAIFPSYSRDATNQTLPEGE